MTKEERKQYCKEYRAEGFGKIADRIYYQKHADRCKKASKDRYERKKLQKFSQESRQNLEDTK